MKKVFIAVAALGLMSSCGGQPVASTTPSAQPPVSASPSSSPATTPSAIPSPSPVTSPSPTAPAGFAIQDFSGGSVAGSDVVAVRIGQHDGYDRMTIEFASGVPSYSVTRQPTTTFTRSPRGDQVTLQGSAGVLVVVHSVTNWTGYSGPTAFNPGYPCMLQALQVENYEGVQQWALGIQGTPALRVFTMSSPSRLVVDVAVAG